MGATMLLAGMLAAIVSAPLFDRVFTNHLAITSKILVPISALGWFVLIWAGTLCFPSLVFMEPLTYCLMTICSLVRPNNTVALFVLFGLIGIFSVPMIPVGMELACEVTRNPDGSAAIVWLA